MNNARRGRLQNMAAQQEMDAYSARDKMAKEAAHLRRGLQLIAYHSGEEKARDLARRALAGLELPPVTAGGPLPLLAATEREERLRERGDALAGDVRDVLQNGQSLDQVERKVLREALEAWDANHWTRPNNRACAGAGLKSYRYLGERGVVIMQGARNDAEALKEAARSLTSETPTLERLEKWDGLQYVPVVVTVHESAAVGCSDTPEAPGTTGDVLTLQGDGSVRWAPPAPEGPAA